MCKKLQAVYLECECSRCNRGPMLDKDKDEGYYPHFGTKLINGRKKPAYYEVKPEDQCSTAVIDKDGHYQTCSSRPQKGEDSQYFEVIFKFVNDGGSEPGKRLCKKCRTICERLGSR
ncbi:hypothetical protein F4808DRAFT_461981 [Astrocystis sublimbata]|nr:hypothetical protein F4808DRAFT_461981 [Astrocystis sublimbata]